jgi:hypothetical protein
VAVGDNVVTAMVGLYEGEDEGEDGAKEEVGAAVGVSSKCTVTSQESAGK